MNDLNDEKSDAFVDEEEEEDFEHGRCTAIEDGCDI